MVCYTNDKLTKVSHLFVALPLASVLFVILLEISSISASMMTGGIGDQVHQYDKNTQDEVNKVKNEFEKQTKKSFCMFEVVSYKTQVVAGTNKFVKVKVGNGEYAHLKIFIPLPYVNAEPSLTDYQLGKKESDPISDNSN